MDSAAIVKLILIGGVVLIVVSIGLRARPVDALLLIRNPALGARAMTAMFVIVPAFVVLMTLVLPLDRPIRAALLALAMSPMPPILSGKEIKAGGDADYAIGLQVLATAVSIIVVPVMMLLLGAIFGQALTFDPIGMATTLAITVGVPLAIGLGVGQLLGDQRMLLATWAGRLGMAALGVGTLIILYVSAPNMGALIGSGVLWAAAAMTFVGLAAGHLLGGPGLGNRGALAVASAARHPGVAIALAAGAFPDDKTAIVGVVLLYLLANAVVTIPYMKWRARALAVER